ncbi:MAG: thioredoxin family protein [Bacteroidetes bacterium]|jgi:thioredoxin-related protein|nr:thioredoxin family protein [Bacteroidota bacterium]MBT3749301.1 thioredoxin family protein [Bacteroidota bacterium]MBT4398254.1 thioredoxin family protein [Bacteroidota bacterium]MBT4409039.1 thioredoxin family protein [Bacteroidota bacterium]MBT5425522.1 thioredoxin family protein [Bacteroidota bacterium]
MKTKHFLIALLIPFLIVNCKPDTDEVLSSDQIMKQANRTAFWQGKKVMVLWHASWCGWCDRMDSLMNRPEVKEAFDDNYVIKHLVVKERESLKHLENPGGDVMLAKYHGDKAGIPFWVVLDRKGNLLGDSFMREEGVGMDEPGKNAGCPANKDEVDHFIKLLKETSKMTDEDLDAVRELFFMKR